MSPSAVQQIKAHYDDPKVVAAYGRQTALQPCEEFIFSQIADELRGKAVLDIGVGTGRTTPYLLALTERYIGIDYSEKMLEECRRQYPGADVRHCDARDLSPFGSGSFDFVLYAFNAIDDLDHEGRLHSLAEIFRVLRPGGLFAFSAHNLDAKRRSAFTFRGFDFSGGPLRFILNNTLRLKRYGAGIINHLRMRRQEFHGPGYSFLNDSSHSFSLMAYYIRKEQQLEQLRTAGFSELRMVGSDGSWINPGEHRQDGWIYYLARKSL
jgi:SAM-dependent methyltransferase